MSGKTFKTRAVVLRKTKLGEKDLIVTLLDESGSLLKCVAKGARKPGSSLAAKAELFTQIDALVASGRSLGILVDVRMALHGAGRSFGLEQAACAAPVAELASIVAQEDLPQARLYAMTCSAFSHIHEAQPAQALALCAAGMWKVIAQAGFKPRFDSCASCGDALDLSSAAFVPFSVLDGGVLCPSCRNNPDAMMVDRVVVQWSAYFLGHTFVDIEKQTPEPSVLSQSMHLVRQWVRAHTGRDVKSLDFVFAAGLF